MKGFQIGEEIETTVVQISNDTVFIDLGLKSEGFVDKSEFLDKDGNITIKEGDKIKVYFVSSNRDELHFTTRLSADKAAAAGLEILENAYKSGLPVEGKVEGEIKGGFEVKLGAARAFCPYSQMGYKNRGEPSSYIGKNVSFIITEYKNEGKNIIVSNRKLLENEEAQKITSLSKELEVGKTFPATVVSLQSYGAFVDINGFQALLPISEISHERVSDVASVLSVGQKIEVKIIKAEWNDERPDRSKVSVSTKELEADPWDGVAERFPAGTKISGSVARVAPFGLFINIAKGIDGLVHVSALSGVTANSNLKKMFKVGEAFDVVVDSVDEDEKRISLLPATSEKQDDDASEFLSKQKADDGDTYNPFAALLKK